jgi:hypothetical protein
MAMIDIQPYDLLPIWGVFLFSLFTLFLAVEAGLRLGKQVQKRWPDHYESGVGMMVGASLAFLGFLLAFITGIAINIYNQRIQLVISEANAIGTTYLRAGYLDEPISSESRQLLREYVDLRLSALDRAQLQTAITRSEEIHHELWSRAEILAKANPVPTIALYISSLNEMIDLHTERINMELKIRVPAIITIGSYLVAVLTMMLIGIQGCYTDKRNYLALMVMIIILSLVFVLIIDLDRSQQGFLTIPQKALIDLQRQIQPGS